MEWGNFWSSHLPRTSYDIDLDAESSNPNDMVIIDSLLNFSFFHLVVHHELSLGEQSSIKIFRIVVIQGFEKMIAGLYLGDIVRRVIRHMSQVSDIFGPTSSMLSEPYVLRYVSSISLARYLIVV